ncbi:DUF2550 domain-containing protein [Actinomyces sp. B33]|uniref:DUF2550 family protein n=1 Tax=Actinomyces sp. B33 TaxID=2942131 RepID=UPI00233FFF2A|nr:DUF2550 family protein [Actinomyces sp. B33]MDC4232861.1 DUF2550 domain-containing protein [Actinomyces sp. B33]
MSGWISVLVWALVVLAAVGVLLWAYINIRANRLISHVGSFRAWSRPDTHSGWTSGIGMYGVETLSWYRLVGLTSRAVYTLPRRGLELSAPIDHSPDGLIVEIRLKYADRRYEMAVTQESYNGLVSWIESGPPHVR